MEAREANLIASGDSAWASYSLWDPTTSQRQMWFRTGHAIPDTVAADSTLSLSGTVILGANLVVEEGGTLEIADSTRVFADRSADPPLEIVVRGTLRADGTAGAPIRFSSWVSDSGAADSWGGLVFDLEGTADATYGYVGAVQPISSVTNATIANAEVGVRITNLVAPTLEDVTFQNIEVPAGTGAVARHILLDGTDVVLPYGLWVGYGQGDPVDGNRVVWDLEAPVSVVATNTVAAGMNHPLAYGHSADVDLFVDGVLITQNTAGPQAHVWFRPETAIDGLKTSEVFDGWGGIEVHSTAEGTYLRDAEISHVRDGLFFAYPKSCTVRDTQVHHYKDKGIHVVGEFGDGLTVKDCLIARGESLPGDFGLWGIYAEDVSVLRVLNTKVYDYSHEVGTEWNQPTEAGGGIAVVNRWQFCGTQPSAGDSVIFRGNGLVGPGEDYTTEERDALHLEWACGAPNRNVIVEQNGVREWYRGLSIEEGRDVDVRCNRIKNNYYALEFYRGSLPNDPEVRMKENLLADSVVRTVFVDEGMEKLALGSASTTVDRGLNKIKTDSAIKFYVTQWDSSFSGTDSLFAHQNQWRDGDVDSSRAAVIANCEPVQGTNRGRIAVADGTVITSTDYSIACLPTMPSTTAPDTGIEEQQQGAMAAARQEGVIPDDSERATTGVEIAPEVPELSELGSAWPNPIQGDLRVRFAVGRLESQPIRISVFDVRGRRVVRLVDSALDPGWREVQWDGRDSDGSRVAAGVYFLRFEAGGVRETRKIVRLR